MANFHWRTDEEDLTDPPDLSSDGASLPSRRVVYLVLFVGLLLAGAYTVYRGYRGVEDHLEETTERVEAEVRASHNVVQSAARGADPELFVRFLSGADAGWSTTQERLVAQGAWLDRASLDLQWQPSLSSTTTISLSSDLTEATLTAHEVYRFTAAGGEAQNIQLEQVSLYRLGPDRWLYAPPRPEFWGETKETSLSRLQVAYPARDEDLVGRLAGDLDSLLQETCGDLPGDGCPEDFQLALRFGADAALLLPPQERMVPLWADRPLTLPAPTLVGLPLDDAGYQALYQAYARYVVSGAMVELAGWQCCDQGPFVQILLDRQLEQLGLPPFAGPEPDFRRLLSQQRFDLGDDFRHLWSQSLVPDLTSPTANSIVAYLLARQPELGPAALLWELAAADSYESWLARVTGVMPPALSLSWRTFLYDATGQVAAGDAPAQSMMALCETPDGDSGSQSRLLRYEGGEALTPVSSLGPSAALGAGSSLRPYAPGGALLAVHDAVDGEDGDHLRLFLWRGDQVQPMWESGEAEEDGADGADGAGDGGDGIGLQFLGSSPEGTYLLVQENHPQRRQSAYMVGEVARCLEGDCEWRRSIYRPLWSPDDDYVINTQGNLLFLTESRSFVQPFWYLDYGSSPFWLDEDSFGYVQHTRDGQFANVVLGTVGYREIQTLVSSNQLQPLLPPGTIMAASVEPVAHPVEGGLFFLAVPGVRSENPAPTYVFAVLRGDRGPVLLFSADDVVPGTLSVSPSGRWLSAQTGQGLLLYDVVRETTHLVPDFMPAGRAVWSPDGSWLFAPGTDGSRLVAPGEDYRSQRIGHDGVCREVVWVEE